MARIGLTQRAHATGYGERRDMLDQRWAGLVERLGAWPVPLANTVREVEAYLEALQLDGLLMTGGNDIDGLADATDTAPERDSFEARAYAYCRERGTPVLGICRGAQMINHLEGGREEKKAGHAGTRHGLAWAQPFTADPGRPALVNSYHNWVIPASGLADGLLPLAFAEDGSVEAFQSPDARVTGFLWHPEREPDLLRAELALVGDALKLVQSRPELES